MTHRPLRILGWRLVLVGLVCGLGLSVLSVPVCTHLATPQWPSKRDRIAAFGDTIEGRPERFVLFHERVTGFARWSVHRVTETNTTRRVYEDLPRSIPPRVVARALRDRHDVTLVETAGFPFAAAHANAHASNHGRVVSAFDRKVRLRAGSWSLLVPARPLPLGLAGNTVFYAAVVLAPVVLARGLLRFRRRRANLCLACGYDMAGGAGVCPECGTLDPKASGAVAWCTGVCWTTRALAFRGGPMEGARGGSRGRARTPRRERRKGGGVPPGWPAPCWSWGPWRWH